MDRYPPASAKNAILNTSKSRLLGNNSSNKNDDVMIFMRYRQTREMLAIFRNVLFDLLAPNNRARLSRGMCGAPRQAAFSRPRTARMAARSLPGGCPAAYHRPSTVRP